MPLPVSLKHIVCPTRVLGKGAAIAYFFFSLLINLRLQASLLEHASRAQLTALVEEALAGLCTLA